MKDTIASVFGKKLRPRVSGILIEQEAILMIRHEGLGAKGYLWAPPGGGVIYGSSIEENLKREFFEETGLLISVSDFLFVNEFLAPPLHAIELFFLVERTGGRLKVGSDPEMGDTHQIISDAKFLSIEKIKSYENENVHNLFRHCNSISDIPNMKGYFNY